MIRKYLLATLILITINQKQYENATHFSSIMDYSLIVVIAAMIEKNNNMEIKMAEMQSKLNAIQTK